MASFSVEVERGIAIVELDRPPVNAINAEATDELWRIFKSFDDDRDVRVAILTAAGDRAFMAGVDLKTVGSTPEDTPPSVVVDRGLRGRRAMWSIVDCAVPVIGAINGPAIGAGLAYAACCDILIAADTATFATTEINVGLLGASAHLSLMVGRHKAREMFFTGEAVSADELHRMGVIRDVVPRESLLATAVALAEELAAKSPLALRMAKASMNHVESLPLKEAYRIEQSYTHRLMAFDDAAEARKAFLEKREPEWKWR